MTSIEWLIDQMQNNIHHTIKIPNDYIEQAKELNRKEIIDAYEEGQKDTAMGFYIKSGESYYNNLKK
jgi:hypothetical protein